ncbi:MAG: hypothetical protein R2748_04130 [Bryobacterales bacterium]
MPHTWDILTRIALSKPYLAAWRALCWFRRPHIYTGDRVVLTRTVFGHWMYIDASDASVAPGLLIRGYWDIPTTRVLLDRLRPGMRFVEVGANVGISRYWRVRGWGPRDVCSRLRPMPGLLT